MSLLTRVSAIGAATALIGGLAVALPLTASAAPSTLMFSAYVEGTANNKAIEIYNPTSSAIDMAGYSVKLFTNGATTATNTNALSGVLNPGAHWVITHASSGAGLSAYSDQTGATTNFNGDDALQLLQGDTVVDSFGQTGFLPSKAWVSGEVTTLDRTLVRKSCVTDTNPTDAFDPATEWAVHPIDTFDVLNTFTCGEVVAPTDPVAPTITPIADTAVIVDSPVSIQVGANDVNGDTLTYTATGLPTGLTINTETGLISGSTSVPGAHEVTVTVSDGELTASDTFILTVSGALPIGSVQGTTDTSPMVGKTVIVEGVVTGNFQTGGFAGYYIQDAGDGNPDTSDGIYIYAPGADRVEVGTKVRVTGRVSEFYGQTQVTQSATEVLATGQSVAPKELSVPLADKERYESMLVTFPQELTIIEYFNFARFGEIVLGTSRQHTPTAVVEPGQPAKDLLAVNLANRIVLDDGRSTQNPTPARHPNGQPFAKDNYFRGGDTLTNVTGILNFGNSTWKIQPTKGADYTATNLRPEVPGVGGNLRDTAMNVLNYFTTLTSQSTNARGADTPGGVRASTGQDRGRHFTDGCPRRRTHGDREQRHCCREPRHRPQRPRWLRKVQGDQHRPRGQ